MFSPMRICPPAGPLFIRAAGDWRPGQVNLRTITSSWHAPPELSDRIDAAWLAVARSGVKLFDGPMCRLEGFDATPGQLSLQLSQTSYRIFVGTNLYNPTLADRYGSQVLANSVGVSVALQTGDGFLVLGRRNQTVVYYPGRLHPFAGALEPRDGGDPFIAARRELHEEAGLLETDISELRCLGLVEDHQLRQPELIMSARTPLPRTEIEGRLAPDEHHELIAIPADEALVHAALRNVTLTPVAAGALLLWGRSQWGDPWLEAAAALFRE